MGRETKTFKKSVESPPVSPTVKSFQTNNLPLFLFRFFFWRGPLCPSHHPLLRPHSAREAPCYAGDSASCATLTHCTLPGKKAGSLDHQQGPLPNGPWAQVARGWSSENSAHHHDDSKASFQGYHLGGGKG